MKNTIDKLTVAIVTAWYVGGISDMRFVNIAEYVGNFINSINNDSIPCMANITIPSNAFHMFVRNVNISRPSFLSYRLRGLI